MSASISRKSAGCIDWNTCPGLWRDPKRMSGAWCFDQSRVPLSILFGNLSTGMTVVEFLYTYSMDHEDTPTTVLRHMSEQLQAGGDDGGREGRQQPDVVDWAKCPSVEKRNTKDRENWVFSGTQRKISGLFNHIAEGGSLQEYCREYPEVDPGAAEELLDFLVEQLETASADRSTA